MKNQINRFFPFIQSQLPALEVATKKASEVPDLPVAMFYLGFFVMLLVYEAIALWVIKRDVISKGNWALINIIENYYHIYALGWGYRVFIFVLLTWLAPHFAFQDKFQYKHQAVVEATVLGCLVMAGWIWFRYNVWDKHYF